MIYTTSPFGKNGLTTWDYLLWVCPQLLVVITYNTFHAMLYLQNMGYISYVY